MAEHFIEDDMAERGVREADSEYRDWRANSNPTPNQVSERVRPTMSTETGGLSLTLTLTLTLTRCPRGRL